GNVPRRFGKFSGTSAPIPRRRRTLTRSTKRSIAAPPRAAARGRRCFPPSRRRRSAKGGGGTKEQGWEHRTAGASRSLPDNRAIDGRRDFRVIESTRSRRLLGRMHAGEAAEGGGPADAVLTEPARRIPARIEARGGPARPV